MNDDPKELLVNDDNDNAKKAMIAGAAAAGTASAVVAAKDHDNNEEAQKTPDEDTNKLRRPKQIGYVHCSSWPRLGLTLCLKLASNVNGESAIAIGISFYSISGLQDHLGRSKWASMAVIIFVQQMDILYLSILSAFCRQSPPRIFMNFEFKMHSNRVPIKLDKLY